MRDVPGYVKTAVAVPVVQLADPAANAARIAGLVAEATQAGAAVVVFPELSLTGYTCGDLLQQPLLLDESRRALDTLRRQTADCPALLVVGMPLAVGNALYDCAVVLQQGAVAGVVPKSYLPAYAEFQEPRWFTPGAVAPERSVRLCGAEVPFGRDLLFTGESATLAVELCEDLWVPIPPSSYQALAGAELMVNLAASNDIGGKHDGLRRLVGQQSARTLGAYCYAGAGWGESTTDLVFGGCGMIAENGTILGELPRFGMEDGLLIRDVDVERLRFERRRTTTFRSLEPLPAFRRIAVHIPACDVRRRFDRTVSPDPFLPAAEEREERCAELFALQCTGLARRIAHTGVRTAVVGISGGLDSTLALMVAVAAFDQLGRDRRGVVGITMPGFGTTDRTLHNARALMEALGIRPVEISIAAACTQHFADIGLDARERGAAYENAQARERTQILMDVANREQGLVVGTGDLSELALGWATYNGDHMSMYGVNAGVPKGLVRMLVAWLAEREAGAVGALLRDVLATPVSPELLPPDAEGQIAQQTEALVGPYRLHDFFLYHMLHSGFEPHKIAFLAGEAFRDTYDAPTIRRWLALFLRRFFTQQFKRSALPDGPKTGSVSLSPRGDWRMPSDAAPTAWLRNLEEE